MHYPSIPTFSLNLPAFPTTTVDPCGTVTDGKLHCSFAIPDVQQLPSWILGIVESIGKAVTQYLWAWIMFIPALGGYYWQEIWTDAQSTFIGAWDWILNDIETAIADITSYGYTLSTQSGVAAPIIIAALFGGLTLFLTLTAFGIIKGIQTVINLA